jgi:hypothetical protein
MTNLAHAQPLRESKMPDARKTAVDARRFGFASADYISDR